MDNKLTKILFRAQSCKENAYEEHCGAFNNEYCKINLKNMKQNINKLFRMSDKKNEPS